MTKTPTPDGAEMGERLRLVRSATIPPARDLQVARTERSPGFGRAARLPGFPVASSRYDLPVTVAGAGRACPRLPGAPLAFWERKIVYPERNPHAKKRGGNPAPAPPPQPAPPPTRAA